MRVRHRCDDFEGDFFEQRALAGVGGLVEQALKTHRQVNHRLAIDLIGRWRDPGTRDRLRDRWYALRGPALLVLERQSKSADYLRRRSRCASPRCIGTPGSLAHNPSER